MIGLKKSHKHVHDKSKRRLSFESTKESDKNCFHPTKDEKKICGK